MTKEERWRMEGMSFCMRLLDENGGDVEALRKELKRRGALGIPIGVTERQTREFVDGTKKNVLTTVTLLTIAILHDTFGFGSVRVARFIDDSTYRKICEMVKESAEKILADFIDEFAEL